MHNKRVESIRDMMREIWKLVEKVEDNTLGNLILLQVERKVYNALHFLKKQNDKEWVDKGVID